MSSYFKRLRQASFRGIPFMLVSDETQIGRRIVTHEFPGRDEKTFEDLGLSVREFSIEAVIAGSSFKDDADAFEAALVKKGSGTLVHPHYGEVEVVLMSARRLQSSNAVGEVRFNLTFQRYNETQYPSAARNTAAGLLAASDAGFAAVLKDFQTAFKIDGLPDFVSADAITRAGDYMDGLKNIMGKVGMLSSLGGALPVLDILSNGYAGKVIDFYKGLMDLVAPVKKAIVGNTKSVAKPSVMSLIRGMQVAASTGIDTSAFGTGSTLSARAQNAQALDYLHQMSALSTAAGSVRYVTFASREEALSVRNSMIDQISALRDRMGVSGWDDSWRAAGTLQAALNRDINERIGRLPRTIKVQSQSVRSSLAIAHRLYGDNPESLIEQASDIVERNLVRHPGFVPAKPLEVLIDVK